MKTKQEWFDHFNTYSSAASMFPSILYYIMENKKFARPDSTNVVVENVASLLQFFTQKDKMDSHKHSSDALLGLSLPFTQENLSFDKESLLVLAQLIDRLDFDCLPLCVYLDRLNTRNRVAQKDLVVHYLLSLFEYSEISGLLKTIFIDFDLPNSKLELCERHSDEIVTDNSFDNLFARYLGIKKLNSPNQRCQATRHLITTMVQEMGLVSSTSAVDALSPVFFNNINLFSTNRQQKIENKILALANTKIVNFLYESGISLKPQVQALVQRNKLNNTLSPVHTTNSVYKI